MSINVAIKSIKKLNFLQHIYTKGYRDLKKKKVFFFITINFVAVFNRIKFLYTTLICICLNYMYI
jgi:hypothetical protein